MDDIKQQLNRIERRITSRWMTVDDAAQYCGCSRTHFEKVTKGVLPCSRIGAKRLYDREDIDNYLKSKK